MFALKQINLDLVGLIDNILGSKVQVINMDK